MQSQFQKGNYNEWDTTITKTIPDIDTELRNTFLPKLDGALKSMLGGYTSFTREELNAYPFLEETKFTGVCVEITYIVDDFHVQNVPEEAVHTDEESLQNYLTEGNTIIKELKINTNTGELKITVVFSFNENQEENTNDKI